MFGSALRMEVHMRGFFSIHFNFGFWYNISVYCIIRVQKGWT